MAELSEAEIEAIHEAGAQAALGAWGPAGVRSSPNPHPPESEAHEIWAYAFRNAYARENR